MELFFVEASTIFLIEERGRGGLRWTVRKQTLIWSWFDFTSLVNYNFLNGMKDSFVFLTSTSLYMHRFILKLMFFKTHFYINSFVSLSFPFFPFPLSFPFFSFVLAYPFLLFSLSFLFSSILKSVFGGGGAPPPGTAPGHAERLERNRLREKNKSLTAIALSLSKEQSSPRQSEDFAKHCDDSNE